jgi:hypothetical protein
MKFKGPRFPSFTNPSLPRDNHNHNKNRSIEDGETWVAHSGRKARLRNLKQLCRSIVEDKDPSIIESVNLIREVSRVDGIVNEAGMYYILNQAREISDSTGVTLPEALTVLVDKELKQRTEQIAELAIKQEQEAQNDPLPTETNLNEGSGINPGS